MSTPYEVPSWAGKPPPGIHLDIFKDDKFVQKIMIDEKKCYLFGRNPDINDFRVDHASCSRVHAALVYHKHLNLTYLTDLGSTHGTYIGNIRLEGHKPTVVQIGSVFHFGASTRNYTLRERPKTTQNIVEDIPSDQISGLPENQDDVDNLTEYNTATNRKISTLGISESFTTKKGVKRKRVHFNEDEIVINPEDIDDSIGKFRNMVQSTVVPVSKRMRLDGGTTSFSFPTASHVEQKMILHHPIISAPSLYSGIPSIDQPNEHNEDSFGLYASKLLPSLPNPAPEIEVSSKPISSQIQFKTPQKSNDHESMDFDLSEPKTMKKKYAKEAWPKKAAKSHLGDI